MGYEEQGRNREGEGSQAGRGPLACEHCGCATHADVVRAGVWSPRGLLAMEDIPTRVCEGCGEQFYDEETTRMIERVVADPAAGANRQIRVPVFSLTDIESPETHIRPRVVDQEEMEAIESMFVGTERAPRDVDDATNAPGDFLCDYCESQTREAVIRSAFWAERGLVAVEDIPARVCQECGEQFYDDETTAKIAELAEHGFPAEQANREISVPLFSLAPFTSGESPAVGVSPSS